MFNIAIFASGNGSNAENLMHYFKNHPSARVALILSDRKEAGVFERAIPFQVPTIHLPLAQIKNPLSILQILAEHKIDFIVLAGYLKLMHPEIIEAFPNRIINLHPALLPKFGGKGMYGMKVHEAVLLASEKETGITIHYVNNQYDKGDIIFQATTIIDENDTVLNISAKIHLLEQEHLPRVTEELLLKI